jgi:hypothetical protein
MTDFNTEIIREVETMKLTKNTKANNWEVKMIKGMPIEGDKDWVKRMVEMQKMLENEFGDTLSLEK